MWLTLQWWSKGALLHMSCDRQNNYIDGYPTVHREKGDIAAPILKLFYNIESLHAPTHYTPSPTHPSTPMEPFTHINTHF